MLIYFTSGTTGMPKMVLHDFKYPLGHIITAKFWQNLDENKPSCNSGGYRLGQGILGKDIRPMDFRRGHICL